MALPLPPPCWYQSTDPPRRNRPFGLERNTPNGVCALARLGSTIWLLLSRTPSEIPLPRAARLFSCSPPVRSPKPTLGFSPLVWRRIPADTSIPSPAVLALSGRGYAELRLLGLLIEVRWSRVSSRLALVRLLNPTPYLSSASVSYPIPPDSRVGAPFAQAGF